jgi:Fe-S-cluster containining protein
MDSAPLCEKPFWEEGIRFGCRRCSLCCTRDTGYVFLTGRDVEALTKALGLGREQFLDVYCRWIITGSGIELLSLKEKSNNDCFFWKDGCAVYEARPLQCRSYPFWKNFLLSKEIWDEALAECPGVGEGGLHSKEYIESCIANEDAEPIIQRGAG